MSHSRRYERTHGWLTFEIQRDLDRIGSRFWLLLGEARSKCEHIRYVPLARDTAKDMHQIYFAKGVNATTAIEGNTLSEEDVRKRMEGQLELPASKQYLGHEIDNMLEAYNQITRRVAEGEQVPLRAEALRNLNKTILAGLELEEGVVPGEFRPHSVAVGKYVGAPAKDVPYLVDRLCDWLEGFVLPDGDERIPTAFVKAVVAHVYLEWIHPFGDGNGRLGRLAEFLILIQSGVPTPAAHVLTSHYNDTRSQYYRELHAASRSGGDLRSFLSYAAQGFVDGLREQVRRVHEQQEVLMWQAVVDEAFNDRRTVASHRQRHLAVELGKARKPIPRRQIRVLTPTLAEAYAGRTSKTLSRDVNALRAMGLIDVVGPDVHAALDLVRGMRPFVVGRGS